MDLGFLIKTFHELTEPLDRIEILEDVVLTVERDKFLNISNLTVFYDFLNVLLLSKIKEFLIKGLLLVEISIKLVGPELEIQFNKIVQSLVLSLADPEAEIRKRTIAVLTSFVSKTRNLPLVMRHLITYGLKNKTAFNRLRALNCIPDLLDKQKDVFFSRVGVSIMSELLENLLTCLFDNDQNVRKEAENITIRLQDRSYEGFSLAFSKLSLQHQSSFMRVVETYRSEKRHEKFLRLSLETLGEGVEPTDLVQIDLQELKREFYLTDIPIKKEEIVRYFPKDYKKNLYFGFLEENLLLESLNMLDSKAQTVAIQEMCSKCIDSNVDVLKTLSTHMSSFFKYVLYLLKNSESFMAVMSVIDVVNAVLNTPGLQAKIYLPLLSSVLMLRLIEDRVLVRNQVVALMKKLDDPELKAKRNLWHLFEEGLYLACVLFLDEEAGLFSPKEKTFPINFNLKDFLAKIASLLDHKAQKVRKAALETLAVISVSTDSKISLEALHELLAADIYETLLDKIDKNNIFCLNKNGFLELQPTINEFLDVSGLKEPSFQAELEEIQEREAQKEQIEEEKGPEKSPFEAPMTKRDRLIRRNEEFERMVLSEDLILKDEPLRHNELIIPISRIPLTDPKRDLALINKDNKTYKAELEGKTIENKTNELKIEGNQEEGSFLERQSEEFSIVYSEDRGKKTKVRDISQVIAQNKENYLGYRFNNDEVEDENDSAMFDSKLKLPFEVDKKGENTEEKDEKEGEKCEVSMQITENKTESPNKRNSRPDTGQIRSIKEEILKEFMNYQEDRPLWTSAKPNSFSPLKTRSKFTKKAKNEGLSETDRYFMSIQDLWSLEDPGFAMHRLLLEMKSEKWEDQNNALITIRRLAKNHREQLYDMNLSIPHLISDICEMSNAVNPILSKQSILTLIDLSETLKNNLDIALDPIISLILAKNTEFNVFIGEELQRLIKSVTKHCDGNRIMWVISSILGKSGQLPPFKGTIAQIIYLILEKYRTNVIHLKNFPKLIVLLVQLMNDLSYSVRQMAKRALFNLLNSQFLNRAEFEEVLRRNLPEKEFSAVGTFIERHKALIDEKFIEGMPPGFVIHWEESSYRPTEKEMGKQRPDSHLLEKRKKM